MDTASAAPSPFALLRTFACRPPVISIALFVLTFAGFAWVKHWRFAAFVMGILMIHECGHLWMMRRVGLKIRNLYFIPFIGAMITTDGRAKTDRENFDIAIMGPGWGFGSAVLLLAGYAATGNPGLAAGAYVAAVLNLVNMLPFQPLDGGHIVGALNPLPHPYLTLATGAGGIACSIWLAIAARNPVWLILAYAAVRSTYDQLVGLAVARRKFLTMARPVPMTDRERQVRKIAYVGLLLSLATLMLAAVNMPGVITALKANF